MEEHIQAAVFFNETRNIIQVEFSNFDNKEEAMEAAKWLIAALGISTVNVKPQDETIH